MSTSEQYLKEHNIKSVMLMTADVSAPILLISINDEDLRVHITQDIIHNMRNGNASDLDNLMENTVYEYEYKKRIKDRQLKLRKLFNKDESM